MTRITKKNRRGGNGRKRKRGVRHRIRRITKEILGRENGVKESEARGFIRSIRGIGKIKFTESGIFARDHSGGMTENIRDRVVHHGVLDSTMKGVSRILGRRGRIIDTDSLSQLGDGTSEIVGAKSAYLIALNDRSINPT